LAPIRFWVNHEEIDDEVPDKYKDNTSYWMFTLAPYVGVEFLRTHPSRSISAPVPVGFVEFDEIDIEKRLRRTKSTRARTASSSGRVTFGGD
jgi:hypothetical protein